jgi:hypothetical protein
MTEVRDGELSLSKKYAVIVYFTKAVMKDP